MNELFHASVKRKEEFESDFGKSSCWSFLIDYISICVFSLLFASLFLLSFENCIFKQFMLSLIKKPMKKLLSKKVILPLNCLE